MDVLMPQLGETVAEGKITKWFKSAGDAVKPGDNLFEIETDKTSMEVPATFAGTLSDIRFKVGETAKVGAVVAVIAGDGQPQTPAQAHGDAGAPAPKTPLIPAEAGTQSPTAQTRKELGPRFRGDERGYASFAHPNMDPFREVRTPARNYGPASIGGRSITPLARRLASERGIDLSRMSGSGPHGRIVARDVETAQPAPSTRSTGASAAQVKALFEGVAYEEVPLDGMRRTIATRLIEAKQTIPHFYLTADIEIGRLMAMREEANAAAPKGADGQPSFKLSLNDFVLKAWAAALTRVPAANAVWAEDRILRFQHADIGVAVALDGGLITPVLRNADTKSLTALSAEMRDLAARAREKKLKPNEYQGGASAISNLGMYGVREFSAIINPPHATILAVGAARRAAVETADGGVKFVSQMTVTLSCDHRVVDGALGAELLAAFKSLIENPVTFLV
jgi:pyruvate dehydrogenase E2 component (dihydrolipoamide acetyltransferase)